MRANSAIVENSRSVPESSFNKSAPATVISCCYN